MESIVLHNDIALSSFLLYVVIHYPITLLNLAFQLPLNQMTVFNPFLSFYSVYRNIIAYEYSPVDYSRFLFQ